MKKKLVVGLLLCLVASNIGGCGCGTAPVSNNIEIDTEVIIDTKDTEQDDSAEEIIEETEVESTEVTEVTESTEETEAPEEALQEEALFEPYTMYTNRSCNVRAQASKDSELIDTVSVNTEITVIGVEGDWSKLERNGVVCYIKSSLLSKDKVVVSQPSSSGNAQPSGGTAQETAPAPQPSQPAPQQTQPQTPQSNPADPPSIPGRGTQGSGGYDGGTTGTNSVGFGGGY